MNNNLTKFHLLKQKKLIELTQLCRSDKPKYRGFSKYNKKNDLILFIIRKNNPNIIKTPIPDPITPNLYSLFETSDEYNENQQRMSMERPEDQQIEEIIQNISAKYTESTVYFDTNNDPHNDIIYKTNKMKYLNLYGSLGEHDEQILFHGTDEANLNSILRDDFRLTSNAIHGSAYGRGIYFTNDIETAIYYSEREKSVKYIITAIVHVGDIIRGTYSMQNHPLMPGNHKIYDTSVDDINKPCQFIKKHHGTYNILGVIRIENYIRPFVSRFAISYTGGGTVKNTTNNNIILWWIDVLYQNSPMNMAFRHKKKICNIRPGHNRDYRCLINHKFIVTHRNTIIKTFISTKRGEITTI